MNKHFLKKIAGAWPVGMCVCLVSVPMSHFLFKVYSSYCLTSAVSLSIISCHHQFYASNCYYLEIMMQKISHQLKGQGVYLRH